MSDLFIMIPLGCGDAIIANGLVRELSKQYEKVYVPAWTHNILSVQFMFSDLPSVIVQEVSSPNEIFIAQVCHEVNGVKVLKLGTYSGEPHKEPESFDQTFYRQAGVDFSRRWDGFSIPEDRDRLRSEFLKPSAFICDDESRGFNIDDSKIDPELVKVRSWKSHRIFDFCDLIVQATEIHCINSAFAILADSVPTKGKLFMHRYARPFTPYDNFKLRKPWEIIESR